LAHSVPQASAELAGPEEGTWTPLTGDIESFVLDRKARGLAPGTITFYQQKLALLQQYLLTYGITEVSEITTQVVRQYLLDLAATHNPGGVRAAYRGMHAFLRWVELEELYESWRNPMERVQPPRVPDEPLEPLSEHDFAAMLRTCKPRTFTGARDKAILMALLDTGCRASEFVNIDIGDVNWVTGQVLIRQGKGGKPRMVRFGDKTRRAVRAYLQHLGRTSDSHPLWVTEQSRRLTYAGLREITRRRARQAGVSEPSLHSFRRAFALNSLRLGMDVYSLQRLMGHADLTVLRRYLAQTPEDAQRAHERFGPVDNML
jgi:site-specific recombinase XerD